jgi:hypothetical protein
LLGSHAKLGSLKSGLMARTNNQKRIRGQN